MFFSVSISHPPLDSGAGSWPELVAPNGTHPTATAAKYLQQQQPHIFKGELAAAQSAAETLHIQRHAFLSIIQAYLSRPEDNPESDSTPPTADVLAAPSKARTKSPIKRHPWRSSVVMDGSGFEDSSIHLRVLREAVQRADLQPQSNDAQSGRIRGIRTSVRKDRPMIERRSMSQSDGTVTPFSLVYYVN